MSDLLLISNTRFSVYMLCGHLILEPASISTFDDKQDNFLFHSAAQAGKSGKMI